MLIPFGAAVIYKPSPYQDVSITKMEPPTRIGIFAGYELHQGNIWSGNLKIIDWEQLDKATNANQVNLRIIPAQEVTPVKIQPTDPTQPA